MNDNPYTGDGSDLEASAPFSRRRTSWGKWIVRGLVTFVLLIVVVSLFLPATRSVREPARRSLCKNNLKQIALALYNYADAYGGLPPAYTVDEEGNRLHSWRTLILPQMDGAHLYKEIDLTKPWDDPVNAEVRKKINQVFLCPSDHNQENTRTSYVALVGEHLAFHPTRSRSFEEFKDGLSNTILVIELPRDQTWDWMSPHDAGESTFPSIGPNSKTTHAGGLHALYGDGAVRFTSNEMKQETRKALQTIDAGDDPGEF